jgi:hypothetical protein
MGGTNSDTASAAAWELAARQHGLITRRQLLSIGFGPKQIQHRISRGRLRPIAGGVYAVGWAQMSRKRRWMAAVLACGEGAALSHRSAAALWGIVREDLRRVDVSVRRRCELRQPGIHSRSRPHLPVDQILSRDGIPVTTPVRTLVDLATELSAPALERAINNADKHDVIDPEELRANLADFAGEPGVRILRQVLDREVFRLSDSDLEIFFRPIAAAAGLPAPRSKQMVNGYEVDFHWPELGLVVETDGLRYHRTPSAQTRHQWRDQTHAAAGL